MNVIKTNKVIMKSKIDIVLETVNHYNKSNRGADLVAGGCYYITEDGRKCAFGRCMTADALKKYGGFEGNVEELEKYLTRPMDLDPVYKKINDLLEDEYRGHSVCFWTELQILHDKEIFWDTDGLSQDGIERVTQLITNIENNEYEK